MRNVDLAKRRRIMQRSQALGHCVCDPRRPCPCDVFTSQGICPCAGERPDPIDLSAVKLTALVHNAGCASKIAPADLEAVLTRLPPVKDPRVLSGMAAGDDAAVYRIADDLCLVQTVDVMTPCCDDPRAFGRICAANCLSDIYAMGGVPRTALSILAFPSETLDGRIMHEMLRGAMEVLESAGVALVGGHSVKDEEIKLGFAVTGTVEALLLTRRETARPGDALVLTKPLGAGVLGFARQVGRAAGDERALLESMATLNKSAAEAAAEVGVSACTDVTGFGLFGHLAGMVRHSGVTAEIWADELPAFAGAVELLAAGVVPGAVERNREYVANTLVVTEGADEARVHLGFDAQTSGGLLLAVPAERTGALLAALALRSVHGWVIGRITERTDGRIIVGKKPSNASIPAAVPDKPGGMPLRVLAERHGKDGTCPSPQTDKGMAPGMAPGGPCCEGTPHSDSCCQDLSHSDSCCAAGGDAAAGPASAPGGAADAFAAFLKAVSSAGRIDAKTKELIEFALVVQARCRPCVAAHLKKAREMGIPQEELDEAAWAAVAMGGAPVRMFYLDEVKKG